MPIVSPAVNKFWKSLVVATATFLPAYGVVPAITDQPQACAENIPELEKGVSNFALESWKMVKAPLDEGKNIDEMADIDILWNNLQAVFHVSDDTMIEDIEQIRVYAAEEGAKNSDIPPRIVHGALYTGAVLAHKLNLEIEAKKEKLEVLNNDLNNKSNNATEKTNRNGLEETISKLNLEIKALQLRKIKMFLPSSPYFGNVIVDTVTRDGKKERHLVSPSKINELKEDYPTVNVYNNNEFHRLTSYLLGQIEDESILNNAANEFVLAIDIERRANLLDIFLFSDPKNIPTKVLEKSKEYVSTISSNTHSLNENEKEFQANNILLLAQCRNENALSAVTQWFTVKTASSITDNKSLSKSDYIVLQALALLAKDNENAFNVFCKVAASNPHLFFNAYLSANVTLEDTPEREAGVEIINVFNTYPELSRELITKLAGKETTRNHALLIMALGDNTNSFVEYLKNIIQDPLSKEEDKFIAIAGVALARDEKSIDYLLSIGNNSNNPELRNLAYTAVLYIDSPNLIPAVIREKSRGNSFSEDKFYYCFPITQDNTSKSLEKLTRINPFNLHLLPKGSASEKDNLTLLASVSKSEFQAPTGILHSKSKDEVFYNKHLLPMIKYLESCKEKNNYIDLKIAIPMIEILGKANCENATLVLVHMATYPELYAKGTSKPDLDPTDVSLAAKILRESAIENIGQTVNLHDPDNAGAQVLHRIAQKSSSDSYRSSGLKGLYTLALRYAQVIENSTSKEEREQLLLASTTHGKKVIEHMKYHALGHESKLQMRLDALVNEFTFAKVADKFGVNVRKELLGLVIEALKENPNPKITRSIMHAVISNGCKAENIKELGFSEGETKQLEKLFVYFDKMKYFLSDLPVQGFSGNEIEIGIIDSKYVVGTVFNPELADNIAYPDFIRWSDITKEKPVHSVTVASAIQRLLPNAKIHSYSHTASIPRIKFRPHETQTPEIFAQEDITQNNIFGRTNIFTVNQSWGPKNFNLFDPKRRRSCDLYSAFMQAASEAGVIHTISAGNSHGVEPSFDNFGSANEVNVLGLRIDRNNEFIQPNSVFIAASSDAYEDRLAEYTSKQDPLRVDNHPLKMLSLHGVQVLLPNVVYGREELWPTGGTSISAPFENALIAWGMNSRKYAGLKPLSPRDFWRVMLDSSKCFPGREFYEGGYQLNPALYKENMLKANPVDSSEVAESK